MHFLYFAEDKLKRFYDSLVERTESDATTTVLREREKTLKVIARGKVGSILACLGLASLDVGGEISASGNVSFSKEVVAEFTSAQKLKAVLLKLESEGRIADLNSGRSLPNNGSLVVFAAGLKTNTDRRSESEIERIGAVILTGNINAKYAILIQATLSFLESPNAWRRLGPERYIAGFGTLLGPDSSGAFLEVDPIVFSYAEEPRRRESATKKTSPKS